MLLDRNTCSLLLIDVQERLIPLIDNNEHVIYYCDWMLKLASRLNIPILISEQYPQGLGGTIPPLANYKSNNPLFIEKLSFSCWDNQSFQRAFQSMNKKQAVLIGIETHVCVLQTALQLLEQDVEVFLVIEATGSRQSIDKQYALQRMEKLGIQLITAEMAFFEWIRVAGTPEFKQLSNEFLRKA